MLSVKQVHGTDALVLDQPIRHGESFDGGWDALVTNQPGVMVTVRTADCVPVLLHDPVQRVVAAVHAGWRGAVAGIVPKTVALLVSRFGATVERLRMAIGPSAGPCCYEVDEPVLARLREVFPEWRVVVEPVGTQKAHLDLRAFVRRQGLANGLPSGADCNGECLHDLPSRPVFQLSPRGCGEGHDDQRDRAYASPIVVPVAQLRRRLSTGWRPR